MKTIYAHSKTRLPDFFKPLLWSSDFSKLDPEKNIKIIVTSALNYGDLKHWRWLVRRYGLKEIRNLIRNLRSTEFRPRVRRLIMILFGISRFNDTPRGLR